MLQLNFEVFRSFLSNLKHGGLGQRHQQQQQRGKTQLRLKLESLNKFLKWRI